MLDLAEEVLKGIEAIVDVALDAASAVVGVAESFVDVASQALQDCQYHFYALPWLLFLDTPHTWFGQLHRSHNKQFRRDLRESCQHQTIPRCSEYYQIWNYRGSVRI